MEKGERVRMNDGGMRMGWNRAGESVAMSVFTSVRAARRLSMDHIWPFLWKIDQIKAF